MPPVTATNRIPVAPRRFRPTDEATAMVKSESVPVHAWSRPTTSFDDHKEIHSYVNQQYAQSRYDDRDHPELEDDETSYDLPWDEEGRLTDAQRWDYYELDAREPQFKRQRMMERDDWLLTRDPPLLLHQGSPSTPKLEYPLNAFKKFTLQPGQVTKPSANINQPSGKNGYGKGTVPVTAAALLSRPRTHRKRKGKADANNAVAKIDAIGATKKAPKTLTTTEKERLEAVMKQHTKAKEALKQQQSKERRALRKSLKVGASKEIAWGRMISRDLGKDSDSDSPVDQSDSASETVKSFDDEVQRAILEQAQRKIEECRDQISRRQAKISVEYNRMKVHREKIQAAQVSLEIWKRRAGDLFGVFISKDTGPKGQSAQSHPQLLTPSTMTSPSDSAVDEPSSLIPPRLDQPGKLDQVIAARRDAIVISDEDLETKIMPSTLSIGGTDMQPLTGKKARGLLQLPQDLIVLTNLGGDVQFYSQQSRELSLATSLTMDECKAEETVLISEKGNLLATTFEAKDATGNFLPRLSLLRYTSNGRAVAVTQQVFTNYGEKRSGTNTITPISDAQPEGIQFVTGGFNKKVLMWALKPYAFSSDHPSKMFDFDTRVLHDSQHTSAIRTFEYTASRTHLYSGGMDKRVVVWDIAHERAARSSLLFAGAVTNISALPNDHNCLLIQTQTPRMQFQLFDPRQSLQSTTVVPYVYPSFELPQQSGSLSAYVTGTFHPNGHLFVCGSMNPSSGRIYSWDIRYHATRSSEHSVSVEAQSLDLGHNTNVVSTIFDDTGSTMISCSSRNLAWTRIQPA